MEVMIKSIVFQELSANNSGIFYSIELGLM